jgi:dTDP-4-amino-4,6-dideoxygalactose transaminase
MLTTSDPRVAERARVLSLHGLSADAWSRYSNARTKTYEVLEPGYKYNMTDLQASLGLAQLARIDASLERRREIWARYDAAFAPLPVELPPAPDPAHGRHSRHLYSPLVDSERSGVDRDGFRDRLFAAGIGTGVHFTALHLHPYYRERFGHRPGDLPESERIGSRTVSLPLSSKLRDDEVERVISAVTEALAPGAR